jgi:ABC-type sugar transport system substrate-binding protein
MALALALGCVAVSSAIEGGVSSASIAKTVIVPDSQAPTKLPIETPLSKRPPTGKKVVFLDNGTTPAQPLSKGLAGAAAALKWQYTTATISQSNPETLVSAFQSAIQGGANVVVVQATQASEYQQVLPAAQAKGVLVIDQASSNAPTPGITALIDNGAENGSRWGAVLADEAVSNAAGKTVHAAVVTAPIFGTISQAVTSGVQGALHKICSACTAGTIPIPASNIFSGQDAPVIVSYLQSHPETNYLIFVSALVDVGTRAALNSAGFGSVKIVGNDALDPDVAELRSGAATAWLDQPLQVDGWMALDAAARQMTGGNASAYDNRPEPTWLLTTKTHISGNSIPEVPFNYQAQFKKMWKVGG